MCCTIIATVLALTYSPAPDLAAEFYKAHIQTYLPAPARHKHVRKVNHLGSTLRRIARVSIRQWKTGKKAPRSMGREAYATVYRDELKKRGKPDEIQFLLSVIPGESKWNHMAVSYLPPTRMKNGKMSEPLWHCGPAQHQCKTQACCRKFQTDPRFAAKDDLRLLRYFDRWRGYKDGSRVCNWKSGPGSDKCRILRTNLAPTS